MSVPPGHRSFNDAVLSAVTASIATTPVAGSMIAPCNGLLHKAYAASLGTTTGTITVKITLTSSSSTDVAGGGLTIAAGAGDITSSIDIPKVGSGAVYVNEGDIITFTPSGGTGSSIGGLFTAIIREF